MAFDPINEVYLVRWIDPNSSIVWVQLLSSDGLLLGDAVNVFEGTSQFFARGAVVTNKMKGASSSPACKPPTKGTSKWSLVLLMWLVRACPVQHQPQHPVHANSQSYSYTYTYCHGNT